jgi:hypothetical protein
MIRWRVRSKHPRTGATGWFAPRCTAAAVGVTLATSSMMGHRPHICAIALTALRWSSDRREEAADRQSALALRRVAAPRSYRLGRATAKPHEIGPDGVHHTQRQGLNALLAAERRRGTRRRSTRWTSRGRPATPVPLDNECVHAPLAVISKIVGQNRVASGTTTETRTRTSKSGWRKRPMPSKLRPLLNGPNTGRSPITLGEVL